MNESHESVASLLSAYLDGELDPARRRQVEAHLARCANCTEELTHLRAADQAIAGLPGAPNTPDLRLDLRRIRRRGAGAILASGLLTVIAVLLGSIARDVKVMRRKDLPLWGRLGLASGNVLLAATGIAICIELLRDVRVLLEYAWLSDEPGDTGEPHP